MPNIPLHVYETMTVIIAAGMKERQNLTLIGLRSSKKMLSTVEQQTWYEA